jgi:endonuclease YncB( thermonuclease family)
MQKRLLAALLLALACASTVAGQETIVSASVVVHDGDSITVLLPFYTQLKVRLANIDAPELGQAFAQRSKQHLSELVFGRDVELHTRGLDRYGRTLAVVMLDGVDVNLEQVKSGSAWVYEKYIDQADENTQANYWNAQETAQRERRGLWSDTQEPVPPWLYRAGRPP